MHIRLDFPFKQKLERGTASHAHKSLPEAYDEEIREYESFTLTRLIGVFPECLGESSQAQRQTQARLRRAQKTRSAIPFQFTVKAEAGKGDCLLCPQEPAGSGR